MNIRKFFMWMVVLLAFLAFKEFDDSYSRGDDDPRYSSMQPQVSPAHPPESTVSAPA